MPYFCYNIGSQSPQSMEDITVYSTLIFETDCIVHGYREMEPSNGMILTHICSFIGCCYNSLL